AVGPSAPLPTPAIEPLAVAPPDGRLPQALVPDPEIATATYDKYEAHLLLGRLGLPSPPTVLPGEDAESYPVMVKLRRGSGAESIHLAHDAAQARFFCDYVDG